LQFSKLIDATYSREWKIDQGSDEQEEINAVSWLY